jgi:hypothetical protein
LPFAAELHRPDARGAFDTDFKEPAPLERDDGLSERPRGELPPIRVPAQVEGGPGDSLSMMASGNAPTQRLALVLHFQDLERLGLVEGDGEPLIPVGTRLGAIYTMSGELVWRIRTPPGLYAIELQHLGFGIPPWAPKRNLLLIKFAERSLGAPRGGL